MLKRFNKWREDQGLTAPDLLPLLPIILLFGGLIIYGVVRAFLELRYYWHLGGR